MLSCLDYDFRFKCSGYDPNSDDEEEVLPELWLMEAPESQQHVQDYYHVMGNASSKEKTLKL